MTLEANKKAPETLSPREYVWGTSCFVSSSLGHAGHQGAFHTQVRICQQQLWRGWAVRLLLNGNKGGVMSTELQRSGGQRRPQSIIDASMGPGGPHEEPSSPAA